MLVTFWLNAQDLGEAVRFWSGEVSAGRVKIRRRKMSREDPWAWTECSPETVMHKGVTFIPILDELLRTALLCVLMPVNIYALRWYAGDYHS